jgi:hypothetical protein
LVFFSDPDADASLADNRLLPPFGFNPTVTVAEAGTVGLFETFLYVQGPGPAATTDFYVGVSDGRIPEPPTMAMLGAALLGLGATVLWRRGSR